ncbi:uncharacterized protein LOC124944881 [Impatiens glandulifera]|uniref:uncharacterized protein LOC124944881 n=1 Tax=Impatiens glandulifera TaxID=253017 RepID=UPI001FB07380|nr:uncharacterized protein LOC124944881 [Impatiens glandulifera]
MQPPGQHSRINLADLKAQIVTKLGSERSKQYFYFLSRFLSSKISRVEFNKLCLRVLSRENIPLHNQFIRAILKNACASKIPPPVYKHEIPKSSNAVQTRELPSDGNWKPPTPTALSNGDILSNSHRQNPFGPNGKINIRNGLKSQSASAWSSLHAPLGVPLCPGSVGGARRAVPLVNYRSNFVSSSDIGILLDSVALKERLERIAATQGLQGVSADSANILNNGLNCYLKNLMSSCIHLSRASSNTQQTPSRYINGHHSNRVGEEEGVHGVKSKVSISLQDFRVAMEMNPLQLGEDWPILLEKICTHSFEE